MTGRNNAPNRVRLRLVLVACGLLAVAFVLACRRPPGPGRLVAELGDGPTQDMANWHPGQETVRWLLGKSRATPIVVREVQPEGRSTLNIAAWQVSSDVALPLTVTSPVNENIARTPRIADGQLLLLRTRHGLDSEESVGMGLFDTWEMRAAGHNADEFDCLAAVPLDGKASTRHCDWSQHIVVAPWGIDSVGGDTYYCGSILGAEPGVVAAVALARMTADGRTQTLDRVEMPGNTSHPSSGFCGAVTHGAGAVYWSAPGQVRRVPLDHGPVTVPFRVDDTARRGKFGGAPALFLVSTGDWLLVTVPNQNDGLDLYRVPIKGQSRASQLAPAWQTDGSSIQAADADFAYWLEDGELRQVRFADGKTKVLATVENDAFLNGVLLDSDRLLYLIERDEGARRKASLWTVRRERE